MASLLWFIVFLLLVGTDRVLRSGSTFGSLALGALAAALASLLGAGPVGATGVFFGLAILAGMLAGPLARRWARRSLPKALPGLRAQVTERLDPDRGTGQVQFPSGAVAPAVSDHSIPVHAWVEVVAVDGARLRVRPLR